MLHDGMIPPERTMSTERRATPRAACPAEVVLFWLHDPHTLLRLRLTNVSDGGYRLHASLPVIAGTTGVVLRLLPDGREIDQPVLVAWTRENPDGGYDIGLRRI